MQRFHVTGGGIAYDGYSYPRGSVVDLPDDYPGIDGLLASQQLRRELPDGMYVATGDGAITPGTLLWLSDADAVRLGAAVRRLEPVEVRRFLFLEPPEAR